MFTNLLFLILILGLAGFADPGQTTDWVKLCLELTLLAGVIAALKKVRKRALIVHILLLAALAAAVFYFHLNSTLLLIVLWFSFLFYTAFIFGTSKREIILLLPFTLPYLFLTAIFYIWPDSAYATGISLAAILLIMIFFPVFIQKIWLCEEMPPGELKDRLLDICQKTHFKNGGLMTWGIMDPMLTAGIIGIVPRFRYILFTKSLLKTLKPESIQAILAHEIGHSYRKHLLFYPFLLFGIGLLITVIIELLPFQSPLAIFLVYAALLALFFRIIFGFYSRLFERQADLHALNAGLTLASMREALDEIAIYSGRSHKIPSWHHFSIHERIEFLKKVETDPLLAEKHHNKTRFFIVIYLIVLFLGVLYLFWR